MEAHLRRLRPVEHICAICSEAISKPDGAIRSLDQFLLDQLPEFQTTKSSVMHQHCFQAWEYRKLYIRLFNQHHKAVDGENYIQRMKSNGSIEWHWHRHQK